MTLSELFSSFQALATALRAGNWVTGINIMRDLLVAYREAIDKGEVKDTAVASTSCPTDAEGIAGWLESQVSAVPAGDTTTAAFPWQNLPAVLKLLLDLFLNLRPKTAATTTKATGFPLK